MVFGVEDGPDTKVPPPDLPRCWASSGYGVPCTFRPWNQAPPGPWNVDDNKNNVSRRGEDKLYYASIVSILWLFGSGVIKCKLLHPMYVFAATPFYISRWISDDWLILGLHF
jgi:hypothetical protein